MTATAPLRQEWLEERRSYIGASDSPIIIGVSPYRSAYELWLEKTGRAESQPDSAVLRFGRRVEQAVAEEYADQTGRRLERFLKVQRHKQYPFIACNPDRRVVGEKRIVQIKTSWKAFDGQPDPNAHCVVHDKPAHIPEHMDIQVQHEMGVTGAEVCDLTVATGFAGLCIYERPRDDLRIHRIFTIDRAWWQRHMVMDVEPERTGKYIRGLRGENVMTSASALQIAAARRYTDLGTALTRLAAQQTNVKDWLKRSLAGAKKLTDAPNGLTVTWTPWEKPDTETDWALVAKAYRTLLDAQISVGAFLQLTEEEQGLARHLTAESLDGIRSLYTRETTKSGESWRVTWKDQPQEEGETDGR